MKHLYNLFAISIWIFKIKYYICLVPNRTSGYLIAGCLEHPAIFIYDINSQIINNMSSLNQLISEIAHSVQQPNSVPVRRALRQAIIHARNELIRQSFGNHHYIDQVLKQRFRLTIIDVPDGDVANSKDLGLTTIKRTLNKVPRPVRLDNNLPFHSVRTVGLINPINIPFTHGGSSQYYKSLPGMSCSPTYVYENDYIYISNLFDDIGSIIVESVFEYPHEIKLETSDKGEYIANVDDDDEFFLPEDMVNSVKKLTLETFNAEIVRESNEIPVTNLVK